MATVTILFLHDSVRQLLDCVRHMRFGNCIENVAKATNSYELEICP